MVACKRGNVHTNYKDKEAYQVIMQQKKITI